jgi:hypothetical protein
VAVICLLLLGLYAQSASARSKESEGYLLLSTEMKEICKGVNLDGRGEQFYDLVLSGIKTTQKCLECVNFLKSFSLYCKPKKPSKPKKKKKGEEDTPVPQPKVVRYLEPNVALVDYILETFRRYAQARGETREIRLGVVRSFAALLQDPERKKRGQQTYFSTLAVFIQAPFERDIRNQVRKGQLPPSFSADSLFE